MSVNPFQNFVVKYGANERVFAEGDLGTTMYIVQSGKIRLFRNVDGQKRVLIDSRGRRKSAGMDDHRPVAIAKITIHLLKVGNVEFRFCGILDIRKNFFKFGAQ